MKQMLILLVALSSFSASAVTDAEIIAAAFASSKTQTLLGGAVIDSVRLSKNSSELFQINVNEGDSLADGCSYVIHGTAQDVLYSIGPATTGVKTVVKVYSAESRCGGFGI